MPYGDLAKQKVQRFAAYSDLDKHECTIEEREEYEPHIDNGIIIYSGVDYGAILDQAEKEADVILWDGGNNDFSFYKSDLEIVVADPHRAGHELLYHPGETNFRRADVIVINKMDTAEKAKVAQVLANIKKVNPKAVVIRANSKIIVENGKQIAGKRVLVIEDGPTLTHGGMKYGAGIVAAQKYGAAEIIDPRPYAVGSIKRTFQKYSHLDKVLPGHGLRREADRGAGQDDRQDRLRPHRQRDAHRHHPGPHDPPADPPRGLRARGDRFADPQGRPEGLLRRGRKERMKRKTALIAFGGNALLPDNEHGRQEDQLANAREAAELMVHVVKKGYELIIVHGNGPQVGNLLIQMEAAADRIPPYSLDVCDAMTEGSMAYMLEKSLINELRRNSLDKEVASVVTQVVVDKDDPAFEHPTKPVGPFYTEERAQALDRRKEMDDDRGRRPGMAQGRPVAEAHRRRPQVDHPGPRPGRPHRHRGRRGRHPGHHQRPRALRGRRGRHRQGLRGEPARPRGQGGPVRHPDGHRSGLSRLREARRRGRPRS